MRGLPPWLAGGLMLVVSVVATPAAAYDETADTAVADTAVVLTTIPDPGLESDPGELAPGASPDGLAESGPVLTFPPDTTATTAVDPAGPTLLERSDVGAGLSSGTKSALLLVMLTAVPSLTVGTALWLHRDAARRPKAPR